MLEITDLTKTYGAVTALDGAHPAAHARDLGGDPRPVRVRLEHPQLAVHRLRGKLEPGEQRGHVADRRVDGTGGRERPAHAADAAIEVAPQACHLRLRPDALGPGDEDDPPGQLLPEAAHGADRCPDREEPQVAADPEHGQHDEERLHVSQATPRSGPGPLPLGSPWPTPDAAGAEGGDV